MKQLLTARNLHKSFEGPSQQVILQGVDLDLYSGQTLAIMGASGEGKSTLLHLLGGLDFPSQGDIKIQGVPLIPALAPALRLTHIGFVFQAYHLLSDYTALQNVLMPAWIAGESVHRGSSAYYRAQQLLDQVGLKEKGSLLSKYLSGGEKQRVAIARAFMNDPSIILADEPSGNLDRKHAGEIHKLFMDMAHVYQKGVVLVTHNPELASLCQSTLTLREGKLHQ